jgi:DNA invertase Pin-like site-specific DNA recombinase
MASRRKRITYLPNMARRAVLYARYSSTLQADGWSIEAQVSGLRAYCERMGWTALDDICTDEAISGATDERPGLERAMAHIREGRANVLVVHKLDRFFRDMAKTFTYVRDLEDMGAGLVCTEQPIDTTNPVSGKIVLAVMAALAEIYLDNLSEETSKGKRARAAAGLPNGDLPYGYVLSKVADVAHANNKATALIVPEEAAAVRAAYDLRATGHYGDAMIARMLNDRGYHMRSKRQGPAGRFNKDSIRHMLTNRFYAGMVVQPLAEGGNWAVRLREGQWVRGRHEPIIDPEYFEQVQAARRPYQGVKEGRGPMASTPHHAYLARGIARCGVCGHRLWGQGATNRTPHYRCNVANRGGTCGARKKSVDAGLVDVALGEAISALRLPEGWRQQAELDLARDTDRAARMATERAAIDRKIARLKGLVIDGVLSAAEYHAERARLEDERALLATAPERGDVDKATALLDNIQAMWLGATTEERRDIATDAVDALYCDLDDPTRMIVRLKEDLWPILPDEGLCIHRVTDGA